MNRFLCGIVLALSMSVQSAVAFDHNFPKDTDRSVFFESLKRPDYYPHPCCGASDAYEADIYKRNPDGSYEVTITDGSEITYPDGAHRIGLPNGATVHVPASRINPPIETQHNPTGHAWLFVSAMRDFNSNETSPGSVYCFAPLPEGS